MRLSWKLGLICLAALVLRIFAAGFVQHPGIADSNHYYNVASRLIEGQGFTTDYIWMYSLPPESIVHPEEHWMPLTSALAALPMALLGHSVHNALIPFILLGALLPLLGYAAARQFCLGETASLFVAAATAALPEMVLNSVRTDTTIPNVVLVTASILLLNRGIAKQSLLPFVVSGALAGLSYLTRNDGLVLAPVVALTLLVAAFTGRGSRKLWLGFAGFLVAAALVVAPWIVRNLNVLGIPTTPESRDMFFFTSVLDHYAYARDFTLETMLAEQSVGEIIGKRLFELAAAFKLMYSTLDLFLPVAVAGGLLLLAARRDRERWAVLTPTLIFLLLVLIAYPVLIPYKSQAGSFKKIYLTVIPLILPLAGYAIERAVTDVRIQRVTVGLVVAFLVANAVELVRADARFTAAYMARMEAVVQTVQTLPDQNGDGQVILMAQDPFMLRFYGVQSVMIPTESRDIILGVADRYNVDYLLMPPDRPALDPIYTGDDDDPRFERAARVEGTDYALYALDADGAAANLPAD